MGRINIEGDAALSPLSVDMDMVVDTTSGAAKISFEKGHKFAVTVRHIEECEKCQQ